MREWVEHPDPPPTVDDCCWEGIACVVCGTDEHTRNHDWDSEDYRTDDSQEDEDGNYTEYCVAHLNPTCSDVCRSILDVRKMPEMKVGEGL